MRSICRLQTVDMVGSPEHTSSALLCIHLPVQSSACGNPFSRQVDEIVRGNTSVLARKFWLVFPTSEEDRLSRPTCIRPYNHPYVTDRLAKLVFDFEAVTVISSDFLDFPDLCSIPLLGGAVGRVFGRTSRLQTVDMVGSPKHTSCAHLCIHLSVQSSACGNPFSRAVDEIVTSNTSLKARSLLLVFDTSEEVFDTSEEEDDRASICPNCSPPCNRPYVTQLFEKFILKQF